MNKEFFGTEDLTRSQKSNLEEFTNKYSEKIKRIVGKFKSVEVRTKVYHKEGKAHKYRIHISLVLKVRKFVSDSEGWDFNNVLRDSFEKIIFQLKKDLR